MNNTRIYKCNHCGEEETEEKCMQKCTGCNSSKVFYCSRECQKLAWSSHKHRCRRKSSNAKKLILNEKIQNFDLVLSYASRYMKNLKYVNFTLWDLHCDVGHIALSVEALQSFFRSSKGTLEKLVWTTDLDSVSFTRIVEKTNGGKVWNELHGLKLLQIMHPVFKNVQDLLQVIKQQEDSILSLGLIGMKFLRTSYHQQRKDQWLRNDCKTVATSIGKCRNLVNLNLNQHYLRDSDIETLLPFLPRLQVLGLCANRRILGGTLTNKSCKIISRACKELRELDLAGQDQVTVAGLKRVFKSCQHLKMFLTSLDLSSKDAVELVCTAPNLITLHTEDPLDAGSYYDIIMATRGRVVPYNEVDGLIELEDLPKSLPRHLGIAYHQSRNQVSSRLNLDMTHPDLVNGWEEEHLWKQI